MFTDHDYVQAMDSATVYEVAERTPIEEMCRLSELVSNKVFLKREDMQPVRSFKIRGAYQKIQQLTKEERARGVVAASAGNHAQGVALSAKKLAIDAIIVMPKTTPQIKVNAVRDLGAQVVLFGDTYDESCTEALGLSERLSRTFIHPYDDPSVIIGQGTVGKEIWEDLSTVDKVFVPVGGGGLISGISVYLKSKNPNIQIIAVESEDSACLSAALEAKERVVLSSVGIFVDGVAVKQIGQEPFRLCEKWVDDSVTVNTDEVCAAMKDIYDDCRAIAEPAGALGIAGVKKYLKMHPCSGETIVAVNTGANVNFDRLRHVSERAEVGEGKEALYAVTIPEEVGSFRKFCDVLGHRHVTEFNYRYCDEDEAHVFVGVQLSDVNERYSILKQLQAASFRTVDLTQNELAILHIRHMVGGRSESVRCEQLYRFQFPERPGALLEFLQRMGDSWNITLFHYRNHGAAYGRVLVGLQIPSDEQNDFMQFLKTMGYKYFDESKNPAYQLFL